MKKLIKTFICLLALTLPAIAHAGLFSSTVTAMWDDVEPTTKYKLKTYGFDVRVYEWTPKDNPDMRCVFVAGETNSTGVACYPAKQGGESRQRE